MPEAMSIRAFFAFRNARGRMVYARKTSLSVNTTRQTRAEARRKLLETSTGSQSVVGAQANVSKLSGFLRYCVRTTCRAIRNQAVHVQCRSSRSAHA